MQTVQSKMGRIWTAENLEIDGREHFTWEEAMLNAPEGFRLPTAEEWEEEFNSWDSRDAAGALGSPLKLLPDGFRFNPIRAGSLSYVGSSGDYWSSSVSGIYARSLYFDNSDADILSTLRANGYSVRYIKE